MGLGLLGDSRSDPIHTARWRSLGPRGCLFACTCRASVAEGEHARDRGSNNHIEVMHRTSDYTPPRSLAHFLIGRPLQTADAPHQTIGKAVGLAVFAADALSSTAYATQESLGVLAAVGALAYGLIFPVSLAIVLLLAIVTISYEQTIHAYPGGGGAYIVARDNLGELPAQTAGAALLTDYVLTVAVSVSSGIAQVVSAYPSLFAYRVWLAVGPCSSSCW